MIKKIQIKRFLFVGLFLQLIFPINSHALEIEVDPLAFALKGYSFHVIFPFENSRIDSGFFGLELPENSKNEYYTVRFDGYGLKWDYIGNSIEGMFFGVEAARSMVTLQYDRPNDGLSLQETTRQMTTYGFRIGYRFGKEGFYISPWLGISKADLSGAPVKLSGSEYRQEEIVLFPTVHIGYRF